MKKQDEINGVTTTYTPSLISWYNLEKLLGVKEIVFMIATLSAVKFLFPVLSTILLIGGAIIFIIGGILLLSKFTMTMYSDVQDLKIKRAMAYKAQLEASFTLITDNNGQIFVGTRDNKTTFTPLHLQGSDSPAWLWFQAKNKKALPKVVQKKEEPIELSYNINEIMSKALQSYAIIGGQQTGKTYQAQHIANYWLSKGVQPIVIGCKWDKGEWDGCQKIGGGGDFEAVAAGLKMIEAEAKRRQANTDLSHKSHSLLPVFFDDWTVVVDQIKNAKDFILKATTLFASVNIVLYFILHSDTSNAWGVDKKGSALKDNFTKLIIVPTRNKQGLVDRQLTRGFIQFAGYKEQHKIKLNNGPLVTPTLPIMPYQFSYNIADLQSNVQSTLQSSLQSKAFTPQQIKQVLELDKQGGKPSNIAEAVFKSKGGVQNKKVKEILALYKV